LPNAVPPPRAFSCVGIMIISSLINYRDTGLMTKSQPPHAMINRLQCLRDRGRCRESRYHHTTDAGESDPHRGFGTDPSGKCSARPGDSTPDIRHSESKPATGDSGGYTIAATCTSGLRGNTCGEGSRSRRQSRQSRH
jgi:hypothetical protein